MAQQPPPEKRQIEFALSQPVSLFFFFPPAVMASKNTPALYCRQPLRLCQEISSLFAAATEKMLGSYHKEMTAAKRLAVSV
jgi:hypothetical protein